MEALPDRYYRDADQDRYRLHAFRGPDGRAYGYDDRSKKLIDSEQIETLHGMGNSPPLENPSEHQLAIMKAAQSGAGSVDSQTAARLRDLKMAESPWSKPKSNSDRFHDAEKRKKPARSRPKQSAESKELDKMRKQLAALTSKIDGQTASALQDQLTQSDQNHPQVHADRAWIN